MIGSVDTVLLFHSALTLFSRSRRSCFYQIRFGRDIARLVSGWKCRHLLVCPVRYTCTSVFEQVTKPPKTTAHGRMYRGKKWWNIAVSKCTYRARIKEPDVTNEGLIISPTTSSSTVCFPSSSPSIGQIFSPPPCNRPVLLTWGSPLPPAQVRWASATSSSMCMFYCQCVWKVLTVCREESSHTRTAGSLPLTTMNVIDN